MNGTNWSGNVRYAASTLHEPASVDELADVMAAATSIRALGSRHSFNTIADTTGAQVSVARLPQQVVVDAAGTEVTVSAGLRYGEFVEELDQQGLALANLASLPHISVAGAIATGTHGSGNDNGSLARAVTGLQIVLADGTVRDVRRGDDDFDGMVVSLGTIGIVTAVTLEVVPRFEVAQTVYEDLTWDALEHYAEITASAYSASIFTTWDEATAGQVWLKARTDQVPVPESLFGAARATRPHHPLPLESAVSTTEQLGVAGPWWSRLPHFRLDFTPSRGAELQSEYLVPREHALDAIAAVRALGPRMRPHLFICELRTIAADDLWLSPSHSTDCMAFHFTWQPHDDDVAALLPDLDAALAPFGGRPHWGKLFAADATRLAEAYPRLADFRELADRLDPDHKLANDLTSRWLGR